MDVKSPLFGKRVNTIWSTDVDLVGNDVEYYLLQVSSPCMNLKVLAQHHRSSRC